MTALHIERLDLCGKSAQQDGLVNGVCHQPLRRFRNILRVKAALLILKIKSHSDSRGSTRGRHETQSDHEHPDIRPHAPQVLKQTYRRSASVPWLYRWVTFLNPLNRSTLISCGMLSIRFTAISAAVLLFKNWGGVKDDTSYSERGKISGDGPMAC